MLESLVNPKRVEKGPWKMFFIGILYASLSILLTKLFFSNDPVLIEYSGMIVVLFCVMFSLPFMYFIIKQEEKEDEEVFGIRRVWSIHKDAVYALTWLFLGFVVAFGFWFLILQDGTLLNAQIETYCTINQPGYVEECVQSYTNPSYSGISGNTVKSSRFMLIMENNIYVLIFTLIFSLIFGAGAIFVLAWNATVIAAAIGVFTSYKLSELPLGIARYMIHGIPEIGGYFVAALAGGILGAGVIRNGIKSERFYHVLENSIILVFVSMLLLLIAALIEVYITPLLF